MKRCAYCGKEYRDEVDECPFDQHRLESFESLKTLETQQPGWFPSEVKSQLALWLGANLVTMDILSVAGVFFLNLAAACWATIDSAKIQKRGSKVLGIAFKPIVVIATCTCLLWGSGVVWYLWWLGFGWYLVLRHRVITTPIELAENHQAGTA